MQNIRITFFFICATWLQDLSSLTKDWTQATVVKAQNPNHQATREPPRITVLFNFPNTNTSMWELLIKYSS